MTPASDTLELALEMIKRFEGCRLRAYEDVVGIWTIGWGETLGVTAGIVWTQEHADAVLRRRVAQFMLATLARCPALHLEPPSRVAACVSLAYNIGVGAFGASSVSRLTMRQDFAGMQETPPHVLPDIQRAARFFYLQQHAFGGKVDGQTWGAATTAPPINLLRIEESLGGPSAAVECLYRKYGLA